MKMLIDVDTLGRLTDNQQGQYFKVKVKGYGTYYAQKRFAHQFNGTKGFDLGNFSKPFGKHKRTIDKTLIRPMIGIAEALKGVLLTYNLASHINSGISSWATYFVHAQNSINIVERQKRVVSSLEQYKNTMRKIGQARLDGNDITALMKELEGNEMHFAMANGLGSTLRGDTLNLNAYKENPLFKSLRPLFGNNRESYELLKNWFALPDSKLGNKAGQWFDHSELYPKLALYIDGLDAGMAASMSMQRTLMAFPNYSMNFHPALKMFDLVSPYTKYTTQFPKMAYSAYAQGKGRAGAITAAYLGTLAGSYGKYAEQSKTDEYFEESGFAKIGDNSYWYMRSLNPYVPPVDFDSVGNVSVWGNLDRLLFPFDIQPWTTTEAKAP
jgi:hypothetical protein